MASTEGWLKDKLSGLRMQPGTANVASSTMLAQAGDARAEGYIRSATQNPNSLGAPSVMPAAKPADPLIEKITPMLPGSPIDRRGPEFGVPPVKQGLADAPVQLAQMTPEQEAWMKKYDPSAMKSKPAPTKPMPAPAPATPDPLNLKKTTEERMKGAEAGLGLDEVQTAARGGAFEKDDEVLVGEEGPELVKFNEPGTVVPAAATAAAMGMTDRFRRGMRGAVEGYRSSRAARMAGPAPAAAMGTPLPEINPEFRAAPQPTPGAAPAAAQPQSALRNAISKIPNTPLTKGTGALAGVGELMDPNVFAAADPRSDFTAGDRMRQLSRSALRTGGAILGAAGGSAVLPVAGTIGGGIAGYAAGDKVADFLVGPAKIQPQRQAAAASQEEEVQSGTIERNKAADLEMQRQGGLRAGRIQAAREAAVQAASPEAGGTGIPIGGLRYGPANAGANTRRQNVRWGQMDRGLDIAEDRNTIAAATARAELARKGRDEAASREEAGAKRFDQDIASKAVELTPERQGPSWSSPLGEKDTDYKNRVAKTEAMLRGDIKYTVGNRKDRKQYGDMGDDERQQLFLAHKMKSRVEDARGGMAQGMRDYFGNKRFDSKDLYSYMPASAEGSVVPFQGGYVIKTKNGNTISVNAATLSRWNLTGANDPTDADVMELLMPAIKKYQRSQKGK